MGTVYGAQRKEGERNEEGGWIGGGGSKGRRGRVNDKGSC